MSDTSPSPAATGIRTPSRPEGRSPAHHDVLTERSVGIETPEHVELEYELADLGSRFTALLIDGIILTIITFLSFIGLAVIIPRLPFTEALAGWILALILISGFLLFWGYFVFFEGFRNGRTLGKRLLGIRVVDESGLPVTFRAAAIRNLLRIVDMLPPPTWVLGGVVMLVHKRTKRLGDMAAGTLVVRERAITDLPEKAATREAAGAPLLDDAEFAALERYVSRREGLSAEVRGTFSFRLAQRFEDRVPWERRAESADAYLVELYGVEIGRRAAYSGRGRGVNREAASLVRTQSPRWEEYEEMLARARRVGFRRLPEEEVSRFAALYREVAADLARARTYHGSPGLVYSLGRLVAEGHNLIYRRGGRSWQAFVGWVTRGFPELVRRRRRVVALSALLLFGPGLVTHALVLARPDLGRELLGPGMIARVEEGVQREAEGGEYIEVPDVLMPAMATSIIANNVQVTFIAFAGGMLAGVGTVWILVLNGIFIGAVFGLYNGHGILGQLLAFVAPHGVIELTAITIAGGAGLWMGSAILLPGRRTRRDALRERGRDAISLIGGTAVMLVLAGLIEGHISPSLLPRSFKYAFSGLTAALLLTYFVRAGRGEEVEALGDEGI